MTTDNVILILALSVAVSLMISFAFLHPKRKRITVVHFLLLGIYCTVFSILYIHQSEGGSALLWWFYWLLITLLHIVVLIVQLIIWQYKPY